MTNNQIPQNVNGFSTDPAPVGHNGPPRLAPLKARIEAIMERADLTAREKCAGVFFAVKVRGGGEVPASTPDLMRYMSAKDREAVFAATATLGKKGIIEKTSTNGQAGRYNVLLYQQLERVAKELEAMKTSREKPDRLETETSREKPDGSEIEPDGFSPTGREEPVGFSPTGQNSDPIPSCARGVDNNINKNIPLEDRDLEEDRGSGGKEEPLQSLVPVLEAFELYNEMAQRIGLPIAKTLTPARRKAIKARMNEHGGIEAWKTALANIERSKFLRGTNDRSWRADLNFLCQASSFTKVFEGTFGNGAHAGNDLKSFEERGREVYAEVLRKRQEAKQWTR